jgi:hypothetical protein
MNWLQAGESEDKTRRVVIKPQFIRVAEVWYFEVTYPKYVLFLTYINNIHTFTYCKYTCVYTTINLY